MAAGKQTRGVEVRRAIQLHDAGGDLVSVALFFPGVLEKLFQSPQGEPGGPAGSRPREIELCVKS